MWKCGITGSVSTQKKRTGRFSSIVVWFQRVSRIKFMSNAQILYDNLQLNLVIVSYSMCGQAKPERVSHSGYTKRHDKGGTTVKRLRTSKLSLKL